jgi:GNAT superfamily N-acetyltransferase
VTTTLRPEGPEDPVPGGRTRRWQICVNGHPVGGLRTTASRHGDESWGEIAELLVTEGRRRGRATVGVLAAEEVLRSWGCTRVDVRVPAEAGPALRLAEALGFTERMRNMAKRLGQPPIAAADVTDHQMSAADFDGWMADAKADYARALIASGLTEDQARAKSDADHEHMLPQRHATHGMVLRRLTDAEGTEVGSLWVALRQGLLPDGSPLAWVMVVEVDQGHRGRGYGRALMQVAERECLAAGVHDLGLNVFSDNPTAIGLYESLGYQVTRRVLGKPLL